MDAISLRRAAFALGAKQALDSANPTSTTFENVLNNFIIALPLTIFNL